MHKRFTRAIQALLLSGACTLAAVPASAQTAPDNTKVNKADRAKGAVTADQQNETAADRELTKKIREAVVADKDLLRSVFTNLLINSLEAIDGEGGSVGVKLSMAADDRARVEISDTGRGIAPQDIAKIFEPYYSTKETGTGLGLAIVKKAIDDHGGSISVSSKEGSGTTFTIVLPTKTDDGGKKDEG